MKTFIIGGGSSVTKETYALIEKNREGNEVICVNNAFRYIRPDMLVWYDRVVFKNEPHPTSVNRLIFDDRKQYADLQCKKYARFYVDGSETIFKQKDSFVIARNIPDGVYAGCDSKISGIAAISIALQLGRDDIYLFGYDGGKVNGKIHHHHDIKISRYEEANCEFDGFGEAKKKIHNVSPHSKIETFRKISIGEVFG